jgi:hypothetical protein
MYIVLGLQYWKIIAVLSTFFLSEWCGVVQVLDIFDKLYTFVRARVAQ